MLKLDVFDLRDINKIQIVFSQLVAEGVTDMRLAQEMVADYLTERRLKFKNNDVARKGFRKEHIRNKRQQAEHTEETKRQARLKPIVVRTCPSCGEETAGLHYMPACQRRIMGADFKYIASCDCGWSNVYKTDPVTFGKA